MDELRTTLAQLQDSNPDIQESSKAAIISND